MNYLASKQRFIPGLVRLALFALLWATAWAPSASADTMCAAGSLSQIVGTTCDIGSLQFTFGSVYGAVSIEPWGSPTVDVSYWSANDFNFTPVSNGFTLSFLRGAQSITAPALAGMFDSVGLPFMVTVDPSEQITCQAISGGTLSASGTYASSASDQLALVSPQTAYSYDIVQNVLGTVTAFHTGLTCYPVDAYGRTSIQSGQYQATPFSLYAANGSSAGWDGTGTTFTFNSAPTPAVPEPGSLLLLATGLSAVLGMARRKWLRNSRAVGLHTLDFRL